VLDCDAIVPVKPVIGVIPFKNAMSVRLLVLIVILSAGCVHRIQVNPLPTSPAATTIPRSLQLTVSALALEGADHRPGIILLEWPRQALSQAIIRYAQQRGTFSSVSHDSADLRLCITAKLALASRQGRYHYQIQLQGETSQGDQPLKDYVVERTVAGSMVRWVAASDRDPIEAALQLALDDLFGRIEADRALYVGRAERSSREYRRHVPTHQAPADDACPVNSPGWPKTAQPPHALFALVLSNSTYSGQSSRRA
jgi:hypothetical protein